MPVKNDADVIIVGSGGAGLTAAIYAADEGARVLVLDKCDCLGGTFTIAQGTSSGAQTKMQFEAGILDDTPELFYADCMKEERARKVCDPEMLKFYCQESGTMVDWLYDRGAYASAFAKCVKPMYGEVWSRGRIYMAGSARPYLEALLREFNQRVERGDVKYRLNTRVTGLIVENGHVAGVTIEGKPGAKKRLGAPATIVATGGFCGNLDLMRQYKHPGARSIINVGWPAATGDALAWFEKVNAKIINMDQEMLPYMGTLPDPADITRPLAHMNMNKIGSGIWVDVNGKRVANEDINLYFPPPRIAMARAPEGVLFAVIDSRTRSGAEPPFVDWMIVCHKQDWAWFDRQADEGKAIFKAGSIPELAARAGINAAGLAATVERWNSFVAAGKDEDFGRTPPATKLDAPPFYAMLTVPSNLVTSGGPLTTVRTQVVDKGDRVIPGLYAAGEVAGFHPFGTGGGNIGCLVFGKQAGLQAAWYAKAKTGGW